jgi:hypothetical protein
MQPGTPQDQSTPSGIPPIPPSMSDTDRIPPQGVTPGGQPFAPKPKRNRKVVLVWLIIIVIFVLAITPAIIKANVPSSHVTGVILDGKLDTKHPPVPILYNVRLANGQTKQYAYQCLIWHQRTNDSVTDCVQSQIWPSGTRVTLDTYANGTTKLSTRPWKDQVIITAANYVGICLIVLAGFGIYWWFNWSNKRDYKRAMAIIEDGKAARNTPSDT